MAIVISIVLANHGAFNGAVLLRSQAYEIALHLREVQFSAVSASNAAGDFRTVYGVKFTTATTSNANGTYRVFKDNNGNGRYETTVDEDIGQIDTLDPRFEIDAIRVDGAAISGNILTILFERPNFDARFFNATTELGSAAAIEIDVRKRNATGSGCGDVRTVEVTRTGQISVQDCP